MRRLRSCKPRRKALVYLGAFTAFNFFIFSEYIQPRHVALSLDLVYDPLMTNDYQEQAQTILSANHTTPRVLLVSALYPSSDPKRSHEWLDTTTEHFLGQLDTHTYLYTTPEVASFARAARGPNRNLIVDTTYSSPFDVPPLTGRRLVYEQMQKLDSDKNPSSMRYALNNAKPFFLERAAQNVARRDRYDYIFWVDFDAFAGQHLYKMWPDAARLDRIWKEGVSLTLRRHEDLLFFPINDAPPRDAMHWTEDLGPIEAPFAEGSFFGGPPSSIRWLASTFYAYHDHYLTLGFFVGHDHAIYNTLLLLFPFRFITVWASDPTAPARGGLPPSFITHGPLGACGASRKYYQWWLSDRPTREKMSEWWMNHNAEDDIEAVGWWKVWVPCRLTRVLSIGEVLVTALGSRWLPPRVTVIKPS